MDRYFRRHRYGQSSSVVTTPAGQPLAWCSTYANDPHTYQPRPVHAVSTNDESYPLVGTTGYLKY